MVTCGSVRSTHEIGRLGLAAADLHQIGVAVAGGELHQAEAVALRIEAERLGVDGDAVPGPVIGGQIAPMQTNVHDFSYEAPPL